MLRPGEIAGLGLERLGRQKPCHLVTGGGLQKWSGIHHGVLSFSGWVLLGFRVLQMTREREAQRGTEQTNDQGGSGNHGGPTVFEACRSQQRWRDPVDDSDGDDEPGRLAESNSETWD